MSKPRSARRRRLLLITLLGVGAYVLRQATRDQGGSYVPPAGPADDTLEVPDDATADDLERSAPSTSDVADDDVVAEHHVELVPDEEIDVDGPRG